MDVSFESDYDDDMESSFEVRASSRLTAAFTINPPVPAQLSPAPKAKKAPAKTVGKTKKTTAPKKPLTSKNANIVDSEEDGAPSAPAAKQGKGKTIEETYQKKTQLEHILLRPDTVRYRFRTYRVHRVLTTEI
jgi:DNA topoisomerase-2